MKQLADLEQAAARAMIDIIASVPGFTPPAQDRTLRKTGLILSVAARLLQERKFTDISMNDIAAEAACSVTSIYARFQNKDALLPAVHLIILEAHRTILDRDLAVESFTGETLENFSRVFMKLNDSFFAENFNFLHASIVSGNIPYKQTNDIMPAYARRINKIIHKIVHLRPEETIDAVEFSIRRTLAIYRDHVMAGDMSDLPSTEVMAKLFELMIRENLKA